MNIIVSSDKHQLGQRAAAQAATLIKDAIAARGVARILVATGGSQFEFLAALTATRGIAWSQVEMFHLDEYVGIAADHPASFRRYLLERFILPTGIERYHLLEGDEPPAAICERVGRLLTAAPIDVAFAGIGENGHLAFNDPPADFKTTAPYHVVRLDEACRRQQVGEGWFARLEDVPTEAMSISIRQLLQARAIISVVPDARKAPAVQRCLEGSIEPMAPASMLRTHEDVTLHLDPASAALLPPRLVGTLETARS